MSASLDNLGRISVLARNALSTPEITLNNLDELAFDYRLVRQMWSKYKRPWI